ncbi:hypothetical protein A3Q56_02563 [Intoshia linei]|uniref:Actin n=1 Tax=Intoshia linei TaxID=1819745 RepID=A0A177B5Z7_9BILA|nr:hypothetical protein A3Q56_02563 [Intoshia linei]
MTDVCNGKEIIKCMYCTYPPLNTLSIPYSKYLFDEYLQIEKIDELSRKFWLLYVRIIQAIICVDENTPQTCIDKLALYFAELDGFKSCIFELILVPFYMHFKNILNDEEITIYFKINRWIIDQTVIKMRQKRHNVESNIEYSFLKSCAFNEFIFDKNSQITHSNYYSIMKRLIENTTKFEHNFKKAITYLESRAIKFISLANNVNKDVIKHVENKLKKDKIIKTSNPMLSQMYGQSSSRLSNISVISEANENLEMKYIENIESVSPQIQKKILLKNIDDTRSLRSEPYFRTSISESVQSCSVVTGRPKYNRAMIGSLEENEFFGPTAEKNRGLLSIKYPMEHGMVTNWSDMEKIWEYTYGKDQLDVFSGEHPVLITEAPLNPMKNREKMAEIFFETFNVPAFYVTMQAVLSLYATGKITGVVLDSGDGVTHVVPMFSGFAMNHAITRSDIAGRDITDYLKLLLRKEGHFFSTTAEFEILKILKEKKCYVQEDLKFNNDTVTDLETYILPDRSQIELRSCCHKAPELLFRPNLIASEYDSVTQLLNYSINRCDMDIREELYSNIILSGGSTMFKGFGNRLLKEMKVVAPKDTKIKITAPFNRMYTNWIGGSILGSLEAFKKMWLSKEDYKSEGFRAVHKYFL